MSAYDLWLTRGLDDHDEKAPTYECEHCEAPAEEEWHGSPMMCYLPRFCDCGARVCEDCDREMKSLSAEGWEASHEIDDAAPLAPITTNTVSAMVAGAADNEGRTDL